MFVGLNMAIVVYALVLPKIDRGSQSNSTLHVDRVMMMKLHATGGLRDSQFDGNCPAQRRNREDANIYVVSSRVPY
jgi:hypothetical protein